MKVAFKYLVLFIVWAIPLLFHDAIENVLDVSLVNPFLSKFQESFFAEIVFCLAVLLILTNFIYSKFVVRMHVDFETIIYISFLTFYVALYRFRWFDFNHWEFISLASYPRIKFIDIVFAVPVLLLVYRIIPPYSFKHISIDQKYSLQGDSSIRSVKDDKLGREEFADVVAKCILHAKAETFDNSFAVGINAKWGDGKTSFQRMIEEKLRAADKGAIMLTFNAWKSLDEKKIISDFFESYGSEIRKYDLRLGKQILKYGMKLLASKSQWSLFISELFVSSTQEEIFEEINESLGQIKRKVIVFIDDADRLSSKEILEVVKLIRNSANFKNTFFVVGYDQEYLDTALKEHNEYGQSDFLEKIFQIQFDLSRIPPNVIIQHLKEILEEMLPEYKDEIKLFFGYEPSNSQSLEAALMGTQNQGDFMPGILKNLRDVKDLQIYFQ